MPLPSRRTEIIITILGFLGAAIFFGFYDRAFPSASLELKLSRAEIEQRAWQTLRDYGYNPDGYEFVLSFRSDGMANIYAQQTLGIAEYNRRVAGEGLPIWYWQARWFKPLQKEEFYLQLAPDGRVVGLAHLLEETAPGESLEQAAARQLAERYLTQQQKFSLADWSPLAASSSTKPGGRVDHYFEWKESAFTLGDGEHRISVSVYGDQVGAYNDWLKVPEAFTRHYAEQRNKASLLDSLASLLGVSGFTGAALMAAALAIINRRRITRLAWVATLVVLLVSLPTWINSLGLYKTSYATTESYTQFWFELILYNAIGGVFLLMAVFLLWAGGDRLARWAWPRRDMILPLEGDRWANLARSAWRGIMLAGVKGAYIVGFYWLVTQFLGAWSPVDVNYSNIFATPLPALFAISLGVLPGIQEEAMFRLGGISLLKGITGKTWLAIIVSAVLFAFAHASYVTEPFYLRGIELLIPSIFVYGLFYVRFGLVTTIMAHMTYNATLLMLPMLRSDDPYFVFNGLLVALFLISPVLLGLWMSRRRRYRGTAAGRTTAAGSAAITRAGPADALRMAALPEQQAVWQRLIEDPQRAVFVLAAGEAIVGAAIAQRLTSESGRLEHLYVAPAWRDRYWGSRLADAALQDLYEHGITTITAHAAVSTAACGSFLLGQGFEVSGREYTWDPPQARGWQQVLHRQWQQWQRRNKA